MADGLIKDVREIYASIFDHKPVLRREIEFFVKEFEESRRDREIDNLFHILERVTELKESEIPKTTSLADIHLPKLAAELQVAESISDKLLQKRFESDKLTVKKLNQKRAERAAEWDAFVHEMTHRCIRIDNSYKDKEEEVQELYRAAETKLLHQSTLPSN